MAAQLVHPFEPIEDHRAEILILGTFPSPASFDVGFYFSHGGNAFWDIMGELCGARREYHPDVRTAILNDERVAVWDVLERCNRKGALDVDIKDGVPHDFASFLAEHARLRTIIFNGGAAEELFEDLVKPTLGDAGAKIHYMRLPSTSPAQRTPKSWKLKVWRAGLEAAFKGVDPPRIRKFLSFLPIFHDPIRDGIKTMTCRNRRLGDPGDRFDTTPGTIELKRVIDDVRLGVVADEHYHQEGVSSPSDFIAIWKKLHKGRFDPDKTTFAHEFEFLGDVPA